MTIDEFIRRHVATFDGDLANWAKTLEVYYSQHIAAGEDATAGFAARVAQAVHKRRVREDPGFAGAEEILKGFSPIGACQLAEQAEELLDE